MTVPSAVAAELEKLATALPGDQVVLLADHLDKLPGPSPDGHGDVVRLVASAAFEAAVTRLWRAWNDEPAPSGPALALALRVGAATAQHLRGASQTEIVWTGPSSVYVPVRHSSQVLFELVETAARRLTVVSFAAYRVERVTAALGRAARRGVDVRLVLETKEDSRGRLSDDAADAFGALAHVASFWVWPAARRTEHASMHVKAAIRDAAAALVTSANLTGSGLEHNMELGVLVTGGPVARRLDDHFTALMERGDLVRVRL